MKYWPLQNRSPLSGIKPSFDLYGAGETLIEEGAPAATVFRVMTGWLRLQVTSADGVRSVIAFAGPGDVVGSCVEPNPCSVETITAATVSAFDAAAFIKAHPETWALMAPLLAAGERRLADLTHHMQQRLQRSARQRVLCFLAWFAARERPDPTSGLTRLPMTREDISDHLDIAPSSLSRILTKLRDEGLVRLSGPRNFQLRIPRPFFPNCEARLNCGGCFPDGVHRSAREPHGMDEPPFR